MRLDKERLAARLEGHKEGIVQTEQIRQVLLCAIVNLRVTLTIAWLLNFSEICPCKNGKLLKFSKPWD